MRIQTRARRAGARSAIFLFISTVVVLLVCVTTVFYQNQQKQLTHAADMTFVGSPTLPASAVDTILARAGSPMAGVGDVVEDAAEKNGIDDAFALAVWDVETGDGAAGVGRSALNPGGVRSSSGYPVGPGGYTLYASYADGVRDWFTVVKTRYVNHGLTSVYVLCGPYVGTSSAYEWAAKVTNLMLRYHGEAPPPTPTPVVQTTLHMGADSQLVQDAQKRVVLQPKTPLKTSRKGASAPAPSTVSATPLMQPQPQAVVQYQPFLFVAILLATIGIVLSVLRFGRRKAIVRVEEAVQRELDPIMPLPALYVNQFSPLLERETGPQAPIQVEFTPAFSAAPLHLPSLAAPDYNRPQFLRLPSLHSADGGATQLRRSDVAEPARGGLLKRYGVTENLTPKPDIESVKIVAHDDQPQLQFARITEDLWYSQFGGGFQRQEEFQGDTTEDLLYGRMVEVSQRQAESQGSVGVSSRGGGALRRPRRLVALPLEEGF